MANKIIGFFNSMERARQVENDLTDAGFGSSDVRIYEGKDEPGLWDRMKEWFGYADEEDRNLYHEAARRGGVAVVCDTSDDDTPSAERATQIMQRHNPIDLEGQSAQWRKEGWTGQRTSTTTSAGSDVAGVAVRGQSASPAQPGRVPATGPTASRQTEGQSIPVVQEQLSVSKRTVLRGGIRVHSHVTERPVERQVELREERAQVERRPADRPVRPGERAFEERAIEVTETSEQPVVSKEAKVVEEVNVRKDVTHRTETVRDTVRKTDVDVEKLSGDRPGMATPGTPGRTETGTGMGTTSAGAGDFDPAVFVSSEMGRDRRYQGKDWDACETDFRRSYEQRYPQSRWDQVKDRVRAEYTRVRNKV